MPTNANTFNSRVTSEALEAKYRQVFPAQGGAELVQDLFASGVIQPVVDFSSVAEGSVLSQNLQTAWDFSTGSFQAATTSFQNVITNTGFWQIDLTANIQLGAGIAANWECDIYDGTTSKPVWGVSGNNPGSGYGAVVEGKFVVFLRTGDVFRAKAGVTNCPIDIWYRQIADISGNLVNPLGFTFS